MLADDPQDMSPEPFDPLLDDPDPRAYDDEAPPPPGAPVPWRVEDEAHAARMVDEIRAAHARAKRIKASCAAMVARAEADAADTEREYRDALRVWAAAQIEGGKRKSVLLPTGKLSFRTRKAGWVVDNKAAALLWAIERCPAAVVHEPRLRNGPVLDHVEATGEVPTGVVWEEASETFTISGDS